MVAESFQLSVAIATFGILGTRLSQKLISCPSQKLNTLRSNFYKTKFFYSGYFKQLLWAAAFLWQLFLQNPSKDRYKPCESWNDFSPLLTLKLSAKYADHKAFRGLFNIASAFSRLLLLSVKWTSPYKKRMRRAYRIFSLKSRIRLSVNVCAVFFVRSASSLKTAH